MLFRLKPVVVAGISLLCLLLAAGSFYVHFKLRAQEAFKAQLKGLTGRDFAMQNFEMKFPSTFLIQGFSIDKSLYCPRVKVVVDFFSLFEKDVRICLIELDGLALDLTTLKSAVALDSSRQDVMDSKRPFNVRSLLAEKLLVRDGRIRFKVRERMFDIDHVELRALRVPLSTTPARTEFSVSASLAKMQLPFIGSVLKADGWVNVYARDMEAKAKVIDDVGRVSLQAKVLSRQNDMLVSGSWRLEAKQPPQAGGKKLRIMEDVVLEALSSTDTDVDLGFSFKTRMDDPRVEKINLSGQITTGLNSFETSGNIVAGLKTLVSEVFGIMPASL